MEENEVKGQLQKMIRELLGAGKNLLIVEARLNDVKEFIEGIEPDDPRSAHFIAQRILERLMHGQVGPKGDCERS